MQADWSAYQCTLGTRTVLWNTLPRAEQDFDFLMGATIPYNQMCR